MKAAAGMKSGKAFGSDGISVETIKLIMKTVPLGLLGNMNQIL